MALGRELGDGVIEGEAEGLAGLLGRDLGGQAQGLLGECRWGLRDAGALGQALQCQAPGIARQVGRQLRQPRLPIGESGRIQLGLALGRGPGTPEIGIQMDGLPRQGCAIREGEGHGRQLGPQFEVGGGLGLQIELARRRGLEGTGRQVGREGEGGPGTLALGRELPAVHLRWQPHPLGTEESADQALGVLVDLDVEVEVRGAGRQRHLVAVRAVGGLEVDLRREVVETGQGPPARDAQGGGPGRHLPQGQPLDGEVAQGQGGRLEGGGGFRALRVGGEPFQGQGRGRQGLDLDLASPERPGVQVQGCLFDQEPDALGVADFQSGQAWAQGQLARQALDLDQAAAQGADLAGNEVPPRPGVGGHQEGGDQDERQARQDEEEAYQAAHGQ